MDASSGRCSVPSAGSSACRWPKGNAVERSCSALSRHNLARPCPVTDRAGPRARIGRAHQSIIRRRLQEGCEDSASTPKWRRVHSGRDKWNGGTVEEERRRQIEEEEAYRAKVRTRIEDGQGAAPTSQIPTKKSNTGVGCAVVIVAAILIFAVFAVLGGGSRDSSAAASDPHITLTNGKTIDESGAVVICHDQVRKRLKAPSTANFVGVFSSDYVEPRLIGNSWRLVTLVDAENSFGANIRGSFLCVLDGDSGDITVQQTTP